jgi:glutamine cyclotransferase
MHFGQYKKVKFLAIAALVLFIQACKNSSPVYISFQSPDQGQAVKIGDVVDLKLELPSAISLKSVAYLVDGKLMTTKKDADVFKLATKDLTLGYRLISAVVAYDDQIDTVNINIIVKSDIKPRELTYELVKTFPHDTSAYTQGLNYEDGKLLESTGERGFSVLRWVELSSGKTLQQVKLDPQYFGEGSFKLGDRIIVLTYQENVGLVFDAKTFKQIGTFPYEQSREGWGLTFDGKHLLKTDGSNKIWKLNAQTYKEEGFIAVYDDKGAIEKLNEMEFIDGKIYANVYTTNTIVIIDPKSGKVEATIDLTALAPQNFFKEPDAIQNNVLNGIAWDAAGKRLFVGGKKWPNLYQIKLTKP